MTENGKGRHQGKDAKDARQGKMARHAIGIGMPSSACHRQLPSAIAIGKASSARHRHRQDGRTQDGRSSKVAQYSHTDIERVLRCSVV